MELMTENVHATLGSVTASSALLVREEDPIERGRKMHALWEDVYALGNVETLQVSISARKIFQHLSYGQEICY